MYIDERERILSTTKYFSSEIDWRAERDIQHFYRERNTER